MVTASQIANLACMHGRYKYKLDVEAVGLGVSGGVTALCLALLSAAATGGSAAQNSGWHADIRSPP